MMLNMVDGRLESSLEMTLGMTLEMTLDDWHTAAFRMANGDRIILVQLY